MNVGIDIGGTTIGLGVLDRDDKLIFCEKIDTDGSYNKSHIEESICLALKTVLFNNGIDIDSIESIGIGVPGIVSRNGKKIIDCPNLNWRDVEFGNTISERFGAESFMYNDATSASFGEFKLGKMKGYGSGVMMTLGTGLGGGIIIDGKIFEGSHGIASELGHMIVGDNFYRCGCGRVGCLETFVSGTALIKYMNRLKVKSGEIPDILSAKEVFELYEDGDHMAQRAVSRFIKYLSIGIVNTVSTLDPEIVVLGGGLSLSGHIYIEKLRESVSKWRYFKEVQPPRIELSRLGEFSGVIGSALLGREAIPL